MEFTPINEKENKNEEIYADEIFDIGEYEFKVVSARDAKSNAGNEMIKLAIAVFDTGRQIKVYDYLLEAMRFKLKHFCEATGLEKQYNSGTLSPQMCIGKEGRLKLTIQVDKSRKYSDKNVVEDYCTDEEIPY